MGLTRPIRQRPWRTLAAAVTAPASLVPVALLKYLDYVEMEYVSEFFPWAFLVIVAIGYLGSASVGGIASALRWGLRAPLRAGVVVSLFAVSAAMLGLLVDADWRSRAIMALIVAIVSLPLSLTYCAIAGVRWR